MVGACVEPLPVEPLPMDPPAAEATCRGGPSAPGCEEAFRAAFTGTRPTKGDEIVDGPSGFIGSACEGDTDCDYEGGRCVTDGFARGTCSSTCDQFCPDQDGSPTTFCVEDDELPAEVQGFGVGSCFARCDFGLFPEDGCRTDYACVERHRANQPEVANFVCLPEGEETGLPDCLQELAFLDVDFEPTSIPDSTPDGASEPCHVEDAVVLHPPIHGVDLVYYDGTPTPNIRMSCEGAKAIMQTVDDAKEHGVAVIRHIGTYVCRTIAGSSNLSNHAFGDAIDIFAYELDDGTLWTLEDEWEHDTATPMSEAAQFLYDTSWRYFDSYIWNVVLTPNYNNAHDNHFHVDLTPGSHFRGEGVPGYWGPNPTGD